MDLKDNEFVAHIAYSGLGSQYGNDPSAVDLPSFIFLKGKEKTQLISGTW